MKKGKLQLVFTAIAAVCLIVFITDGLIGAFTLNTKNIFTDYPNKITEILSISGLLLIVTFGMVIILDEPSPKE